MMLHNERMHHLTIRDLPDDLAVALEAEKKRRGMSLNRTVKDLLRRSLGLEPGSRYDNGLKSMAGGWSEDQLEEFERAAELFERIDAELWS